MTTPDKHGQWQPIETAPKDGTLIIGFSPKPFNPGKNSGYPKIMASVMRWASNDDDDGGWNWQLPWSEYDGPMYDDIGPTWFRVDFTPTHWMPLPEPPK